MKAQVLEEPRRMQLAEIPVPSLSEIDVLVRVRCCGLCGSDVAYYDGTTPLGTPSGRGPLVLGHEFVGEVVEVGRVPRGMGLFQPGQRVVVNPVQHCNACLACAEGRTHMCPNLQVHGVSTNGGLAEYCVARYTTLFRLPDEIDDAAGAFLEPLACAVHGLEKLAVEPGQAVLVFGPGPMGLLLAQLAKLRGAGVVVLVGTRDDRLAVGRACGVDHVVNVRDPASPHHAADLRAVIAELTAGSLADRAILATADAGAFRQALDVTGRSAIVVYFGLPGRDEVLTLPAYPSKVMEKEIRFSRVAPLAWPTAIRLLTHRRVAVAPLLSATLPLEAGVEALLATKGRVGNTMKVQVTPLDGTGAGRG